MYSVDPTDSQMRTEGRAMVTMRSLDQSALVVVLQAEMGKVVGIEVHSSSFAAGAGNWAAYKHLVG